jgi:hypothetical protein
VDPESCILSLYEQNKGKFLPHQDAIGYGDGRSLTVICYLNTVLNGGSTHFFNQDFRVGAVRGSIAIFPSNFVYAHEGEVRTSGDKYIAVSFANVDIGIKPVKVAD